MESTIRDFTPDDYEAVAHLVSAVYPEYPETADEIRYGDEHFEEKCKHRRWLCEVNGEVVAGCHYAQHSYTYHPRKFNIDVMVLPDYQGKGLGSMLYDHVMAALDEFDPISVRSEAREDMPRSLRFLERRGFVETMREWESHLDPTVFDFAPYRELEECVRAQGIELKSLRELEGEPDLARRLRDLDYELNLDVPSPEPITKPSVEFFVDHTLKHPNLLPDVYTVALHNGKFAGVSTLWKSHACDDLYTGLTGVTREYRRRGIALAMKVRNIRWCAEHGIPLIKTWNASNNEAMLSINTRLGFVRKPAWIDFRKVLKEEDGERD